ncbi:DUF4440 domain-containing protein [Alsobacter soli]|uniref:DUF4440 domain-containing protein n=1 Tax=Alsobacter soli TaxID=2109933 RepID=A0A2T1HNR7_9HYPH|nr:SgcJ/EcaC family oxidoreductase [Alsobacter soli]PSC03282.1 DUF4440 domain-containing protein [Alsobacter soli]
MRKLFVLASACVALSAVSASAQDKAAITKLNDAFEAAFKKGDFAAVGSMYAEDAFLLPSGSPMIHGRSKIQGYWTEAAKTIGDLKLTTEDVKPLGESSAREIGTFTLASKGEPRQEMSGKYVVIWEKSGGAWKLATDIWNSDK